MNTIYRKGSARDPPSEEKGFEILNQESYATLARKLAKITWAVWYYNKPFDYSPHD